MRTCPFDEKYQIQPACKCKACPYHHSRARSFFNYEEPITKCVLHDIPETLECLNDTSPWTSISKRPGLLKDTLNIRSIRRMVDITAEVARSQVYVLTEIPEDMGCMGCGFPGKCPGGKECEDKLSWVTRVAVDRLGCTALPSVRANIWALFLADKLNISDAVLLRTGKKIVEDHDAGIYNSLHT